MSELGQIQSFFFEAMLSNESWPMGGKGEPIADRPGWKNFTYTSRRSGGVFFSLTDEWGENARGIPVGRKIITKYHATDKARVWGMWYGFGSYEAEVIPFLRKSLIQSYEAREFCGGRGPATLVEGNLTYMNSFEGDFSGFNGSESIIEGVGHTAGRHAFWGGSLI